MAEHETVAEIARRHGFSEGAASAVLQALRSSGGRLAQFNHPELGGSGQWMPGMVMIGDAFNRQLKSRVESLCTELSTLVEGSPDRSPPASKSAETSSWWPVEWGHPNAAGGQGDTRYAYFAARARLAISRGGQVKQYDTGPHVITGVSQQQSAQRGTLVFTSSEGEVSLDNLREVPA